MEIWQSIIIGTITGAFSAGTIYGILHTRLFYVEASVQEAHRRLTHHEDIHHRPGKPQ